MKGPDLYVLAWVVAGVLAAVLLPVLAKAVRDSTGAARTMVASPPWIRKALLLVAFAVVAGVVSLAFWLSAQPEPPPMIRWEVAFLVGFGWEAALEKFT